MSLSVAGVWAVDVWDQTVWADGVWREGAYVAPEVPAPKLIFYANEESTACYASAEVTNIISNIEISDA